MTKLWTPPRRKLWTPQRFRASPPELHRAPAGIFSSSGGGLAAPVATWASDPDVTTPAFALVLDGGAAGNEIQSQASLDSAFSEVAFDDTHTLTSDEVSNLLFRPQMGPLDQASDWYARFRWRLSSSGSWSAWSNTVSSAILTYRGLVDVRSTGLKGYWGCQAAGSAYVGASVIRLRRESDDAEQTFQAQDDGFLDLDAIATFRDAAGLSRVYCVTLFGQGISLNLTQSTESKQPEFVMDDQNRYGALKFVRSSGQYLEALASGIASAQPYHLMTVVKLLGSFTSFMGLLTVRTNNTGGDNDSSALCRLANNNTGSSFTVYTGTGAGLATQSGAVIDGLWTTHQATINSTNSYVETNAVAQVGPANTSTVELASGAIRIGCLVDGSEHMDGLFSECAIWSGDPGTNGRTDLAGNSLDRLLIGY